MKWDVKLYVAGKVFNENVHAVNYQDAKETALARNPKAKVISVNPKPGDQEAQYELNSTTVKSTY